MPIEEQKSRDRVYLVAMFVVLAIGIALGMLGDYRGRKLNENQIKALKNHEIIIADYEKLIKLHNASLYVIDRFLAQEKELIQYHKEYIKEHAVTHEKQEQILDLLKLIVREQKAQGDK